MRTAVLGMVMLLIVAETLMLQTEIQEEAGYAKAFSGAVTQSAKRAVRHKESDAAMETAFLSAMRVVYPDLKDSDVVFDTADAGTGELTVTVRRIRQGIRGRSVTYTCTRRIVREGAEDENQ